MIPIDHERSDKPAPITLRTDAEIDAITKTKGDAIWLKNIQTGGDHGFVETFFKFHDRYESSVISATYSLLYDIHGEVNYELMTTDLLDKVSLISTGLHEVIRAEGTGPWFPNEYRRLVRYFASAIDEWDTALTLIRLRRLTTYDELMRLNEGTKGGTAPSLLDGTL